jgi:hypothetical protein
MVFVSVGYYTEHCVAHSAQRTRCVIAEAGLAMISDIAKGGYVGFIFAALKLPVIDDESEGSFNLPVLESLEKEQRKKRRKFARGRRC